MSCSAGSCTYNTNLKYTVRAGNITSLHWDSNHSHVPGCVADIGRGAGWFKFYRNGDITPQRVSATNIQSSDPNAGGNGTNGPAGPGGSPPTTFSGGSLPVGVTITRGPQAGDYHEIDVKLNPGSTTFGYIDILLSFLHTCSCQNNVKTGEQVVQLLRTSFPNQANPIQHNGATRNRRALAGGVTEVTYTWTSTDTCTQTNARFPPTFLDLQAWERMTAAIAAGTPPVIPGTNPPRRMTIAELMRIRDLLLRKIQQSIGTLTSSPLAMVTPGSLWGPVKPDEGELALVTDLIDQLCSGETKV